MAERFEMPTEDKAFPREIIISNDTGSGFSTSWYGVNQTDAFNIIENKALIAAKREGKTWVEALLVLDEEGYPQTLVDNLWGAAWPTTIIATVEGPYILLETDGIEWALEKDRVTWRY